MRGIIRITVLSLFFSVFYQPVSASSNRNNLADVAHEDSNTRRPNLPLESSDVYSSVPTGSVISFAGDKAPQGWLLCDGQEHSNIDYPELYSVIGMTYVPRDSDIHRFNQRIRSEKLFCVPDMRGRTTVGVDSNASRITANNTLGASSGEEKHQLTVQELAKHSHKTTGSSAQYGVYAQSSILLGSGPNSAISSHTCETGNDQPHNNMQPYLVLNYIIKTGQEEANNQRNEITELKKKVSTIDQLEQKLSTLEMASAKAWVVFEGTNATISDSYNIASVVKNYIGNYTINFTKSFSSHNYCVALNAGHGVKNGLYALGPVCDQPTKTSFRFYVNDGSGGNCDAPFISACFYGTQ